MRHFFVYNLKQALFFIQRGLVPIDIGVNRRKVFHKFVRDEEAESVFSEWCNNTSI